MAIQHTIVFTRPNTDIAWFDDYDGKSTNMTALNDHVETTYMDTGKCSTTQVTGSTDGLTKTIKKRYANEAAVTEFFNDAIVMGMINERNAYNTENGITRSITKDIQEDMTF